MPHRFDMTPHPAYLAVRYTGLRDPAINGTLEVVDAELRRLQLGRVLLDGRGLIGPVTEYDRSRSLDELRRHLGWARCAFVIDPVTFTGVQQARVPGLGLTVAVFFSEDDAVQWLLGDEPPPVRTRADASTSGT